jgi:hypothetical protein
MNYINLYNVITYARLYGLNVLQSLSSTSLSIFTTCYTSYYLLHPFAMFEYLLLVIDRDDFLQLKDGSKKGRAPPPRGGPTPTLGQRLTDFLGTTFNLSLSLNRERSDHKS